jgi:hypothetical protein
MTAKQAKEYIRRKKVMLYQGLISEKGFEALNVAVAAVDPLALKIAFDLAGRFMVEDQKFSLN